MKHFERINEVSNLWEKRDIQLENAYNESREALEATIRKSHVAPHKTDPNLVDNLEDVINVQLQSLHGLIGFKQSIEQINAKYGDYKTMSLSSQRSTLKDLFDDLLSAVKQVPYIPTSEQVDALEELEGSMQITLHENGAAFKELLPALKDPANKLKDMLDKGKLLTAVDEIIDFLDAL